ncbi:MarR family winged helix-turn-helix transcriptional regulator [Cupriavidus basilensis]|uniref:MarR family transcriptional regulator n=1 Tax=Cupriavidus basilensis TaxID=68895 RepID=A0A643FX44_9BURK|nr:MarR family transcriptional regulator [Cupriavidus basilensis]QOT79424.1 MarR family transcriptional regulator [Cupriavidus basilensis]
MDTDAEVITYERRARVARLINRGQSKLVLALDRDLEPFGVTAAQYAILSTLWGGRGDTAAQLCKEISYSPGAMTRMLDRLEQKLLIRRLPHPDSRRSHKLELSEEGRQLFPELLATSAAIINRFLGDFDSADLSRFEALLERMLARE